MRPRNPLCRAKSPFWDRLASPATVAADAVLGLADGTRLACRVSPHAGRATLVRFRPLARADVPAAVEGERGAWARQPP